MKSLLSFGSIILAVNCVTALKRQTWDHNAGDAQLPLPQTLDLILGGKPGIDFPNFQRVPKTSFHCNSQPYAGMYADPEAGCQAYHVCHGVQRMDSFVCPTGTLFSQQYMTCDYWYNVRCEEATAFYHINQDIFNYRPPQPTHRPITAPLPSKPTRQWPTRPRPTHQWPTRPRSTPKPTPKPYPKPDREEPEWTFAWLREDSRQPQQQSQINFKAPSKTSAPRYGDRTTGFFPVTFPSHREEPKPITAAKHNLSPHFFPTFNEDESTWREMADSPNPWLFPLEL